MFEVGIGFKRWKSGVGESRVWSLESGVWSLLAWNSIILNYIGGATLTVTSTG